MKSFRENPDGEENRKATRENSAFQASLQHSESFYDRMRLEASENCRHVYREDSTVCELCGT